MAKKRLKDPRVPPGDRLIFFETLQSMVLIAGDPSTTDLGARIERSHQAAYKALTGPKMPSWQITRLLVQALGGDEEGVLSLWQRGVAEQRAQPEKPRSEDQSTSATAQYPAGDTAINRKFKGPVQLIYYPDEGFMPSELSPREKQVLKAWLMLDTKFDVAQELSISLGTVNTHLERIRQKLATAGRPAPTKAAMMARALQDELVALEEL